MDKYAWATQGGLWASPHSPAHPPESPHARSTMPHACLPQAPCATCNVRRFCIGEVEPPGVALLDDLMIGRRRLRKGQKLYRAGEPFDFLFAVRVGTMKSTMTLADGMEHVTAFHFAGDIIGFDGMADGRHPTTASALENVEVCSIPHARLGELCAGSKEIRRRVSQLTGLNIMREYRAARLVRRRLTEKRVAGFLLEISQTMQDRGYSGREFQLRMSRADIGSYLGTSLETISRALSEFQRQALIRVHSRRIELLQPQALREFAEDPAQA